MPKFTLPHNHGESDKESYLKDIKEQLDILKKAWKGILHGQVFDENFLMAVATVGAIALENQTKNLI